MDELVELIAAGRAFRPCPHGEDATHLRCFHQADGICVAHDADLDALKVTVQRVIQAVLGPAEVRWRDHDFGFTAQGLEADVRIADQWLEVSGSGTLRPETLRDAGFDPGAVGAFACVPAPPREPNAPFSLSVWCSHDAIADLLVKAGARLQARNRRRRTPSDVARDFRHPALADRLDEAARKGAGAVEF